MEALAALERLGGVGSVRQIVALSSRRKLREAVRRGEVVRGSRGRYLLASGRRAHAGMTFHPDLVDERHRVASEADTHEFHTGREAHARDCVRYTALTVAGWLVLRFTWEQVMLSPAYVRSVLADVVARLECAA